MGLAACVGLLCLVVNKACYAVGVVCSGLPVLGLRRFGVPVLSQAVCLDGFVGWPSSLPPNSWLVPLSGALGRGLLFGLLMRCSCFRRSDCIGPGRTGWPPERVSCTTNWSSCARCCCRGRPYLWACCACSWPAPCLGICTCVWPASMVARVLLARDQPPWSGVLFYGWASLHGPACCTSARRASCVGLAVLVRGPPLRFGLLCWWVAGRHGQACCAGSWSASRIGRVVLVLSWPPLPDVLCCCTVMNATLHHLEFSYRLMCLGPSSILLTTPPPIHVFGGTFSPWHPAMSAVRCLLLLTRPIPEATPCT